MGHLCTECREEVAEPQLCWDGGAFDGEPIHERCMGSAERRMFEEAAQIHRDLIDNINEQIARLRARYGLAKAVDGQ
jgi:hypothetical protein